MRKLSFGLVVFAAVVVFASAIPLDKRNGPGDNLIGLKGVEKSRLRQKPPGKVPGPKLIQELHVTSINVEEFEKNRFGSGTAALEDVNKAFLLLSEDNKDRLASLSNHEKKHNDKKDLTGVDV